MNGDFRIRAALRLYQAAWGVALPLLAHHGRLRAGFQERLLKDNPPDEADLWIQAASVGEAYLAAQLLEALLEEVRPRLLLTANTAQGLEILRAAGRKARERRPGLVLACRYFPFDRPSIMAAAAGRIRPRLAVLLETEIWPGLLIALKARGVPCLLANGRLSRRSLRRYRLWPGLWRRLAPERVLAISAADAERFRRLFGTGIVGRMSNIKFDRLAAGEAADGVRAAEISALLPPQAPFVVLGSIRKEEEHAVAGLANAVLSGEPDAVIGLFPRHLHRIDAWEKRLAGTRAAWQRRSRLKGPVRPGTVILWDRIGELSSAYRLARAAFVGGSLAPKGGQNFLEALAVGVRPIIGPSWENFAWVGPDIVSRGLLRVARSGEQAAGFIREDLRQAPVAADIRRRFTEFVRSRQGGSRAAANAIREMLEESKSG